MMVSWESLQLLVHRLSAAQRLQPSANALKRDLCRLVHQPSTITSYRRVSQLDFEISSHAAFEIAF